VSIDADLNFDGISVRDRFLVPSQIRALLDCARLRRARGDFEAARIGGGPSLQRREDIRGDSICWITPPLWPAEQTLLEQLEQLRLELNAQGGLGLFELELHYAWYPPGAGYARHVDQPQGALQRTVSLVLYLNAGWELPDGGALRIHEAPDLPVDIEPLGGRLVCFLTAGREHEVLPARRERLSVSGWFRGRE
jgi:SM-20-related protein